ncbi:Acetyl esterase/lipase [Geodermatophilus amargosae]|uniref:Acetyl esterase/lipase n=1 Tax=Geodermatophilus amargosae TaxID=1296565 RepID=A0A1I7CV70_9ACTN|nr:alpha/beta hydrolase fold domain-containing protein [Geodermatophilus amargosae]SFU03321.1 Acetyl esterase/lipase [Geodermatophilus amargosae]
MTGTALYRLVSRGLPRLPFSLNVGIQRLGRMPRPGKTLRAGRQVETRTAGGVPVSWLDPALADRGVLVYVHGGSYVTGPVARQWRWLSELSAELSMAAVMVDYRLAPEHPHPAALDDVVTALRALVSARVLRPGRWALAGDSAGGALALAATQTLVADGSPLPAALVLMAPWVDLALANPQIPGTEPDDPVLSRRFLQPSAAAYAGRTPLADHRLSPLRSDLAGLPPVHITAGTRDILVHDVRLLRQRLLDAGVAVDFLEEPGALHAYPILGAGPAADRAVAAQAAFLREDLEPERPSPVPSRNAPPPSKENAMSKRLSAHVDIGATPERVWEVLTDLAAYPEWNPFIVRAEGAVGPGRRLTLTMQPVGGRAMTLRPRLMEVAADRVLRWRGRLGLPGLMDAEHTFGLQPQSGGTRLVQSETFRGILVPFVAASLDRSTLPAFVAMNEALKRRAEEPASTGARTGASADGSGSGTS